MKPSIISAFPLSDSIVYIVFRTHIYIKGLLWKYMCGANDLLPFIFEGITSQCYHASKYRHYYKYNRYYTVLSDKCIDILWGFLCWLCVCVYFSCNRCRYRCHFQSISFLLSVQNWVAKLAIVAILYEWISNRSYRYYCDV